MGMQLYHQSILSLFQLRKTKVAMLPSQNARFSFPACVGLEVHGKLAESVPSDSAGAQVGSDRGRSKFRACPSVVALGLTSANWTAGLRNRNWERAS